MDGDGFFEYRCVSEAPLKNQVWKDSAQAIVYPDGSQVPDPIAVCDVQGFAYMSFMRVAGLCWWFGEKSQALSLFRRARELKRRFNDAFWMSDPGTSRSGWTARGDTSPRSRPTPVTCWRPGSSTPRWWNRPRGGCSRATCSRAGDPFSVRGRSRVQPLRVRARQRLARRARELRARVCALRPDRTRQCGGSRADGGRGLVGAPAAAGSVEWSRPRRGLSLPGALPPAAGRRRGRRRR